MEQPIVVEHFSQRRPAMRIAIVSETFPPEISGVAMTLGRLIDGLVRRGHRVQLVRPRQGEDDRGAEAERFEEILAPGLPIPNCDGMRFGLPAGSALFRLPITAAFHTRFDCYPDLLLAAFAAIAEVRPEARLVLVGDVAAFIAAARNAAGAASQLAAIGKRARTRVLPIGWERIHDIFATALMRIVKRHDRLRSAEFAVAMPLD